MGEEKLTRFKGGDARLQLARRRRRTNRAHACLRRACREYTRTNAKRSCSVSTETAHMTTSTITRAPRHVAQRVHFLNRTLSLPLHSCRSLSCARPSTPNNPPKTIDIIENCCARRRRHPFPLLVPRLLADRVLARKRYSLVGRKLYSIRLSFKSEKGSVVVKGATHLLEWV